MSMSGRLQICTLETSRTFGEAVAQALGTPLATVEERTFEDGEYKIRPLETMSGGDVYVVQSLHAGPAQSADDKLNRLLFLIAALKDAGAARVTAVTPYLCYARKDRRTKWQDPLSLRYVASFFEAVGTDRVIAMDIHNDAAFENAFRCSTVVLTAAPLFVDYVKRLGDTALCVISPDPRRGQARRAAAGGVGRVLRRGDYQRLRGQAS